jgi:hypothetical protein
MPSQSERRVSQGGEGVIRTGTPAELRRHLVKLLRSGHCDVARQAGWDIAVEEIVAALRARPLGEPAHELPIRPDDWAANFIEREFWKAGAS